MRGIIIGEELDIAIEMHRINNINRALRSLYRKNEEGFKEYIASWSADIKEYVMKTAEPVFNEEK